MAAETTTMTITTVDQSRNGDQSPTPSRLVAHETPMPENEYFEPALLNLADRIKSRSRKPIQYTQAQKPSRPIEDPQPVPPAERVTSQSPKRHIEDSAQQPSPQRRKISQDEEDTKPIEARDTTPTTPDDVRPTNDIAGNTALVAQMIKALELRVKPKANCFGDRQNSHILHLLQNASAANEHEMLFLSGAEATKMLLPGVFHNGPILTEGQQPLPLQSIEDFLGEYYDDESKIFIQDPSVKIAGGSHFAREVTIGSIKKRILEGKRKGRPWNCLELATHVEDGLRPSFLSGEDTRLLTKLKFEQGKTHVGRHSYPPGYKEVEKWALLAEAGALTEPHQDSHGYSTYITVNQGTVGFGWLSYPSDEERKAWALSPENIPGDRFRYVLMKPGQTVFFPAGTIHFVFRLPSTGHTLAFGGHVLRCSNIVHWVKTLLEEEASPHVTNEDLTASAPGYLNRVEGFVKQAQKSNTLEKWGGAEAVKEFLRLKADFIERRG